MLKEIKQLMLDSIAWLLLFPAIAIFWILICVVGEDEKEPKR